MVPAGVAPGAAGRGTIGRASSAGGDLETGATLVDRLDGLGTSLIEDTRGLTLEDLK